MVAGNLILGKNQDRLKFKEKLFVGGKTLNRKKQNLVLNCIRRKAWLDNCSNWTRPEILEKVRKCEFLQQEAVSQWSSLFCLSSHKLEIYFFPLNILNLTWPHITSYKLSLLKVSKWPAVFDYEDIQIGYLREIISVWLGLCYHHQF